MLLYTLSSGDEVHRYQKSIVILFKDKRKVLSTSHLNGGYRENLTAVFNHDMHSGLGWHSEITPANYREHMGLIARALELDPQTAAGLLTAASMENVAIRTESFEDLTVTAIVTGGIAMNGGRAGDPAAFHERGGQTVMLPPGTINILLYFDADLPEETLTRALVTCTEAKTAALQELMAGSNYSRGLATGSGTDGVMMIANGKSATKLFYAGKHSKLGELIALTVKAAVKETLDQETGLNPQAQFSMLKRWKRFGLQAEKIWEAYQKRPAHSLSKPEFMERLKALEQEEDIVIQSSLYIHLLDQLDWGLLSPDQAIPAGENILRELGRRYGLQAETRNKDEGIGPGCPPAGNAENPATGNTIVRMTESFLQLVERIIALLQV